MRGFQCDWGQCSAFSGNDMRVYEVDEQSTAQARSERQHEAYIQTSEDPFEIVGSSVTADFAFVIVGGWFLAVLQRIHITVWCSAIRRCDVPTMRTFMLDAAANPN